MKFDVISVFSQFFSVLDLSLVGKAREAGIISIHSHDLRQWTRDVHRTVDDTPYGGGAGMVMKPDVWIEAIDAVTTPDSEPCVLAIPTPSGLPLKQSMCENLAQKAEHIVIACGRYEGIDARVAEYYNRQPHVEVFEYSLGDYVLNGGEVAAVALIEAVSRLLPGMVGNPESLAEESHGEAGLLEYPAYTHPAIVRGLAVPEVLTTGHHGAIDRWRKDQALARTCQRRPDMIRELSVSQLNKHDKSILAQHGWFAAKAPDRTTADRLTHIHIRKAHRDEHEGISALAERTFPDAAPPYISDADVQSFIDTELQPNNFAQRLADPEHNMIIVADRCDTGGTPTGDLVGYTWTVIPDGDGVAGADQGAPIDFVTADGVARSGPLMYLEKVYLDRQWRGSGLVDRLISVTCAHLREHLKDPTRTPTPHAPYLWLGTNPENKRAQRAYKRCGFETSGERRFYVGDQLNNDVTMALRLVMAQ